MKLLNIVAARSTWLFDLADLNPKGKALFPDILEWLKETYHFEEAPEALPKEDDGKGLPFKKGEYQAKEELFVNVDVTLFNDGLVANSSLSTEVTDRFLEDLLKTASVEFRLTFEESMIRRRLYLSELTVRLDEPLGNINPSLVAFAQKLSAIGNQDEKFEVGGLQFWTDSTFKVTKTTPFTIERKLNAPFSENRFYTKAPLQTHRHLEMIEELERILASGAGRSAPKAD